MVYKKYIKRGGKLYGPYYYKSIKQNGKVITEYVGPCDEFKSKSGLKNVSKVISGFFLAVIAIVILMVSFFPAPINSVLGENNNYGDRLNSISSNTKKKFVKLDVIGLDVTRFWEQKPSQDRIFDSLVEQCTVAYYQGCGGGEVLLD